MWLLVLKSRLFQIALTAILGALAASWSYWAGNRNGDRLARADERGKAAKALVEADAKYRARETEHASEVESIRIEYVKKAAAEEAKSKAIADDLRVGVRRMRVRAARCTESATTITAAPGTDAEATCELPAGVAERLYNRAVTCDETAEQLSALQDWSVSAVKLCNGEKP